MADAAKKEGDEAFKAKDFATAIKHYTTAIEQNAINGTSAKHVLLSNRSACYASLQQYDKALEDAKACIVADAQFAKGWSRKGGAMYGLGDYAGAAQAYKKCLEKDANNPCKADLERVEAILARGGGGGGGHGSSSRPSATRPTPSATYAPPPFPGGGASSSSPIKGHKAMQLLIVVVQMAAIGCAVAFGMIPDRALGRVFFQRVVVAALAGFVLHAVLVHGLPGLGLIKTMYRALRGTAEHSELQGISRVAMDLNTHNAFYCSLLMSSAPSLILLIPVILHSAVSLASKMTALVADMGPLKAIAAPILGQITSRNAQITAWAAQSEVTIFFVTIAQLLTPSRNFILVILYGQLLRVRYLVSADSKTAWGNLCSRTDGIFLHARSPTIVQGAYNKLKGYVVGLGNPQPKP